MERPSRALRRPTAMLLSAAVLGAVGVVGAPAAAAAEHSAAKANSRWLARQLSPDGTLANPLGGALPDHGLMIDTVFALYASGDGRLATPIVDYLDTGRHATDYYTWDGLVPGQGYDAIITAGSAAKVLLTAEVSGRDPHNFGGHDMVAETEGTIARTGRDTGRVRDYSKNPDLSDIVSNNANMFGQALAVIGLAGVGANDQLAIDTMLTQQCGEGYFRIFFGYTKVPGSDDPNDVRLSTCDEGRALGQSGPDGDTTGLALSAMLAARRAGAANLDDPIRRAVGWLTAHQSSSGGWGGGVSTEAPNTNSTGLIVQALADAGGADAAVSKGTGYLESAQAGAADKATALKDDVGAIAYTPEQYQQARSAGISGTDTWVRASAQASLGLSQVGFYQLTKGAPQDVEHPGPGRTHTPPVRPGTHHGTPPPSRVAGSQAPPPGTAPGTVITPVQAITQAGSGTPGGRLGTYLAGKLVDGDHVEVTQNGRTYVDYDATADLVFALRTLGEQPDATARASRFLLDPKSVAAYAHGVPYEKAPAAYATPLAKLDLIARFLPDQTAMVSTLDNELARLRTPDGRFTDVGAFADRSGTTTGQAWASTALAANPVSAPGAETSVRHLIAHQCADGTFPASLGTGGCATGDLTATAAGVIALNAAARVPTPNPVDGARTEPAPDAAPAALPRFRSDALVRAVTALTAKADRQGLVHRPDATVDLAATAAVAGGRQAAGLDATGTAQTLGGLLGPDGGFPAATGGPGDLPTSTAVAPGVVGRSWTAAADSPVRPAVRLPLPAAALTAKPVAAQSDSGVPFWSAAGFVVLGLALAAACWVGLRYFTHRTPTSKAVSS